MIIKGSLSRECFEIYSAHSKLSIYIEAIIFTNTQFINQKQKKKRQILNSKIIPADKTAHTTLNLKNWLGGKTISDADAEVLNFMQLPITSHSKMWHSTQMNESLIILMWSGEGKKYKSL